MKTTNDQRLINNHYPNSKNELSKIVNDLYKNKQKMIILGGATKTEYGNPYSSVQNVFTSELNKVIDYNPSDLTVTVESGMKVESLMNLLSENNQYLGYILPNKKLSFPYEDTSSNLMIGCNGKGYYWIYFFFNKVNLKSDGFTSDGNSTAKASVKYGEKVSGLELYFGTGSNFIMIDSDYKEVMFERISEYSSIMVQFDHFSDGKRYYKYNTLNFTEAYNQNCK